MLRKSLFFFFKLLFTPLYFTFIVLFGGTRQIHSFESLYYGLGYQGISRVGSVGAATNNAFALLANPALLSQGDKTVIEVNTLVRNGVFTINSASDFSTKPSSSADTIYNFDSNSWMLGINKPFTLPRGLQIFDDQKMGVGLYALGPWENLGIFSSSSLQNFKLLKRNTSQNQFRTGFGLGIDCAPNHQFSLGTGVTLYYSARGNANATIVSPNPQAEIALDVDLNASSFFGVYGEIQGYNLGFSYFNPIQSEFRQALKANINLGGDTTITQPIYLRTGLYQEPAHIDFTIEHTFWNRITLSATLSYQLWGNYQPNYLEIEGVGEDGSSIKTYFPPPRLKNTFNPKLAMSMLFNNNKSKLMAGYSYDPESLVEQGFGNNLLDSDSHTLGFGFSHIFRIFDMDFTPALFSQFQFSLPRTFYSSPESISSLSYQFSSSSYIVGISLESTL